MKYFNNMKSLLCGSMLLLAAGASLTSCTDWLEKDPEAIVAEDEAFKNYRNFQGYIRKATHTWITRWTLATIVTGGTTASFG